MTIFLSRSKGWGIGVTCFLCLVLAVPFMGAAQAREPVSSLRVGIVNLRQVFRNYLKVKDIEDRITQEKKGVEADIKVMENKLKTLSDEIKNLPPDSELAADKYYQIVSLRAVLEAKQKRWNNLTEVRMNQTSADIFNEISSAVARYAKEHHYDLVMRIEDSTIDPHTQNSVDDIIDKRSVLYSNHELDITPQIIEELNKLYLTQKKNQTSAPSSPEPQNSDQQKKQ